MGTKNLPKGPSFPEKRNKMTSLKLTVLNFPWGVPIPERRRSQINSTATFSLFPPCSPLVSGFSLVMLILMSQSFLEEISDDHCRMPPSTPPSAGLGLGFTLLIKE